MERGDLVSYGERGRMMIIVSRKAHNSRNTKDMYRCYCPISSECFWFYKETLVLL